MAVVHAHKWQVLLVSLVAASCTKPKPPEPVITEPAPLSEPVPEPETTPVVPETPVETSPSAALDAVLKTVYFDFREAEIREDSKVILNALAEALKTTTDRIQIAGHCDERGSATVNMALGESRAYAVKTYLVNLGVPAERLTTISFGKEQPAVEGSDESAWAKNRRAEFSRL